MGLCLAGFSVAILWVHLWQPTSEFLDETGIDGLRAITGDAEAQYNLGTKYFRGLLWFQGQPPSPHFGEALNWFRKAVDQGHTEAKYHLGRTQNNLGLKYYWGDKVNFIFVRKNSHELEYALAQAISYHYETVRPRYPQSFPEAVKWFRKAAEQGEAGAQNNLGVMYAMGKGVTQDYQQAIKWFRMAADQEEDFPEKATEFHKD